MAVKTPKHIKSQKQLDNFKSVIDSSEKTENKTIDSKDLYKDLGDALKSTANKEVPIDKFDDALKFLEDIPAPLTTETFEYALQSKISETGSEDHAEMLRAMKEVSKNDTQDAFGQSDSEVPKEVKDAHRDLAVAKEMEIHKIEKSLNDRKAEVSKKIDGLQNELTKLNENEPRLFGKKARQKIKDKVIDDRNKALKTASTENRERWLTNNEPQAEKAAHQANPKKAAIVKDYKAKTLAVKRAEKSKARIENTKTQSKTRETARAR